MTDQRRSSGPGRSATKQSPRKAARKPQPGQPGGSAEMMKGVLSGKTYRSIGEQTLSPAEERFERRRRTSGLVLAPLAYLLVTLLTSGLDPQQSGLAACLATVIVLWVTEAVPIPIGGLIGIGLIVLTGVVSADDAVAPFGSTTVFTFIGAFIIAQAMLKHGLAQRFALSILSIDWIGRRTWRIIAAFGAVTALLSAFVSNTATVAMLLPTAVGLLAVIADLVRRDRPSDEGFDPLKLRVGVALMLVLAYGASVGGLLTPVGSPPNLIGRALIEEATGETITFAEWVATAFPVCLVMFVILIAVLVLLNKPEVSRLDGVVEYVDAEKAALGPMGRAERNSLVVFAVAVTLWITPGIVALVAGEDSSAYEAVSARLDEGIVAVVAAALLFLLPTDWSKREFTLAWSDAARIDWGTIVLFGTGIVFGSLLGDTGLAETVGTGAADTFGLGTPIALTIFAVILAILVSETTSNTASAAIIVPVVIPIAAATGTDPFVPALAATFAASFGFMLPVSTPQNAIVYGSGAVPITKMIRSGSVFDVLGAVVILLLVPLFISVWGLTG